MIEVVDVLVRGGKFTERYDTQRIRIMPGDHCLVESELGLQIGKIISASRMMKARCVDENLPKIIRKASDSDLEILAKLETLESEAAEFCLNRIREMKMDMKLIKVIFAFDRSKGLFMFTADGRVDFRELVRDLAHTFKTRIEMKQIGIRDEARLLGGIGNCGCTLCCVTFLREFHPVSIKMAKDQGLSLIPSKISGLCGRLMCCLQYEHQHYSEQVKSMPKMGKRVMTARGEGRVRQLNILKGLILVELVGGDLEEFLSADVTPYHLYIEQNEKLELEAAAAAAETDDYPENTDEQVSREPVETPEKVPRENRDSQTQHPRKDSTEQAEKRPRSPSDAATRRDITPRSSRAGEDKREQNPRPQRDGEDKRRKRPRRRRPDGPTEQRVSDRKGRLPEKNLDSTRTENEGSAQTEKERTKNAGERPRNRRRQSSRPRSPQKPGPQTQTSNNIEKRHQRGGTTQDQKRPDRSGPNQDQNNPQ